MKLPIGFTDLRPPGRLRELWSGHRSRFATPAAIAAGVAVAAVAVGSGTISDSEAVLVVMGFDPDRAALISALLVGATAAAATTLIGGRVWLGTALGLLAGGALFEPTFAAETANARSASGALGTFDPAGWVLTAITLVMAALIAAWAGATLATGLRPGLLATRTSLVELLEGRRLNRRTLGRPSAAVLLVVLLVITVPAFGELLNISPDSLMLRGGDFVPLAPGNSIPASSPTAALSPTMTNSPSLALSPSATPSPTPTPTPTPHASPGTKPWLAWKPSGAGVVTKVNLPSPWTGGTANSLEVDIYTPAGYDPLGERRYPVLYEAPTGLGQWNDGTGAIAALDQLIAAGSIPATIAVFIPQGGAPFPDSQCADSADGRMWLENFISVGIIRYVDFNYLTIEDPAARAIMGMSSGGFCAAMLAARHPDVYSSAISFSGYFSAGLGSSSARLPYGTQANMDATSPVLLVPRLSDEQKARLYFIIDAAPTQGFYGPQAQSFEQILAANHIGFDAIKSGWLHGWTQVRQDFPAAVEAWAARLVVDGLW